MSAQPASAENVFLTPQGFLDHWQGHRRLTRRVIEAYPEGQFNTFAIGGMRPFGTMAVELLRMAAPSVRGILTGDWTQTVTADPKPRDEVLRLWDESTKEMNDLWPRIPASRFQETLKAFGQYEDTAYRIALYLVDNEVHHRGQGYVYLRALNVEPPHFWER